jgi:hypothetical protein
VARGSDKTTPCGNVEAKARLKDAQAHYRAAESSASDDTPENRKAAVSSAVLAGIAAADAACCGALARASRGDDHRAAERLLAQVSPGGKDAATQLGRLLGVKAESQYGFKSLSADKRTAALRRARRLIDFAEEVLAR